MPLNRPGSDHHLFCQLLFGQLAFVTKKVNLSANGFTVRVYGFNYLPEGMKNKLSMASGGDTEVGKEITHADAKGFVVMVGGHRISRFRWWLRLSAGCE